MDRSLSTRCRAVLSPTASWKVRGSIHQGTKREVSSCPASVFQFLVKIPLEIFLVVLAVCVVSKCQLMLCCKQPGIGWADVPF